jgi:hypothetical protein
MMKRLRILALCGVAFILCIGNIQGCLPGDSEFRDAPALIASADQLKATDVSAVLETPIQSGRNVLWCGAFELAWNEACKLAGGTLQFQPPVPPLATILNRQDFDSTDVDSNSYVAAAGYVRDGIVQRIQQLLLQKFHGTAHPHLATDESSFPRPNDIVAYCYLYQNLLFPTPFEQLDEPLDFDGHETTSFGMGYGKPGHNEMAAGVSILDYRGENDFLIELKTKSPGEHVILAKIAPGATLADTIAAVQRRMKTAAPIAADPHDVLEIPKMNFDISRNYDELCGVHLLPTAPGMPSDAAIVSAQQDTRFLMDEKGVQLRSEVNMSAGCSANVTLPPQHVMIFDRPFLLMLTHDDAHLPYFALWIGNADLLVAAK